LSKKIRRRRRKYIKRKTRIKLEKKKEEEKGCIERGPGSQRKEQAHIRDHYTAWQDQPKCHRKRIVLYKPKINS
jgi:hypothetical protein